MGEREGKYFDEPDSADLYVKYRPHVPIEVYQYVADLCATQQSNGTDGEDDGHGAGRRLALDTGCGSGRCSTWWRHQMETFSALLALCAGNSPVTGEFLSQRPVTHSFGVSFDLNKRFSKQPRRRWSETPSRSLWRHWNEMY